MSPRAAWRLETLGFREVYDYEAGKQDWAAHALPTEGTLAERPRAGDLAHRDVPTCRLDEPVKAIRERVERAGFEACVVVNEDRVVFGILRDKQLGAPDDEPAERAMQPGPGTFRPNVDIEEMASFMAEHDLPSAPITTSDGRLVGLLRREDAARVAHELHVREDLGGDGES
jgi:CBS domain-containing protein